MIPNQFENLHDTQTQTYPKHLPLECLVGHVLVGVSPCGRCAVVALLPQITKPP